MDVDVGPAAGRAAPSAGHPGTPERAVVRRRCRVRGRLHGPARCLDRDGGAAHAAEDVRRVGRRGDVGGAVVPAGVGGDGDGSGALRRHVGSEAALRVRVLDLHGGVRAVRVGAGTGVALRLPGPAGGGGGDAAGEFARDHLACGAGGVVGTRDRLSGGGAGVGTRAGPDDRGVVAGGRGMAAHLLRERAVRIVRCGRRGVARATLAGPAGAGALRLGGAGDLLPRDGGAAVRDLVRCDLGLGFAADRVVVRGGRCAVHGVRVARAARQPTDARPGAVPATRGFRAGSRAGWARTW